MQGIIAFLFFLSLPNAAFSQPQWTEIKGEHFIVFCDKLNEEFGREVAQKAEEYYNSAAGDLGYVRYSNFWKWENRVKIYIYPDHQTYLKETGQQEWSHGMADYNNKRIASYLWAKGFIDGLLAHEITHLVFRDYVGFKGDVPLWLDEGVAQWGEKARRAELNEAIKELYTRHLLLSFEDMMKLNLRAVQKNKQIYIRSVSFYNGKKEILFLTGEQLIRIYYLQAFSLVEFLVQKYAAENFAVFCRQLRDAKEINEALRFAYPADVRDTGELENKWIEYLQKKLE